MTLNKQVVNYLWEIQEHQYLKYDSSCIQLGFYLQFHPNNQRVSSLISPELFHQKKNEDKNVTS